VEPRTPRDENADSEFARLDVLVDDAFIELVEEPRPRKDLEVATAGLAEAARGRPLLRPVDMVFGAVGWSAWTKEKCS